MFSLLFLTVLYFLPSIIGRDKRESTGIFLLNLFLGWTLIGWVVAFLWACASDRPIYAQCAPAGVARFCSTAALRRFPWCSTVAPAAQGSDSSALLCSLADKLLVRHRWNYFVLRTSLSPLQ